MFQQFAASGDSRQFEQRVRPYVDQVLLVISTLYGLVHNEDYVDENMHLMMLFHVV